MSRMAVLAIAVAFAAGFAAADAQTLPPAEAFGNLPMTSPPLLSPDGKHFAFVTPINGRMAAAIYSTTPGEKPTLIGSGGEGIIDYVLWAKNDRLIIVAKQGRVVPMDRLHTWHRAFAVDVNGQNMVKLLHNIPTLENNLNAAIITDVNLDDPNDILMPIWVQKVLNQDQLFSAFHKKDDNGFKYDVYKVDVHTGKGERLKSGDFNTVGWYSDGHGNPVVQIYQTKNPLQEHVLAMRGGNWVDFGAYDATADNDAGIVGLSEDGKVLVQSVRNDETLSGVLSIDIATGAKAPLFFANGRDVDYPIIDSWTGRVLGVGWIDDKPETKYFDPKLEGLQNGLQGAFPGRQVSIVSYDRSRNDVVVGVEGPRNPTLYYFLDRTTHQTTLLTSAYPSLKDSDLGEMKPYPYKARDGIAIPAYITVPPGKTLKNLPVVVFPHGGPDNRDYIRFDWMAQFLANRGYLVLQPNFRGSSGYGHKFTELGLKQWGLKMQDDITDGVRKLIGDGIADPKRICIVGGSYGGYAALAGATFTPDLYACAVSWAGVSDLPVQMGSELKGADRESEIASFWISRMGDNLDQLAATSPARHTDQVKCPILLLHGANDTTVRIEQSELMADALKKAGKPVEFVTYEGEDHHLELAATRIRVLKELERFLKAHIGS